MRFKYRLALLAIDLAKDIHHKSYACLNRSRSLPYARCVGSGLGSMIDVHLPPDSSRNGFVIRQLSRSIQVIDRAPDLPPPGHT